MRLFTFFSLLLRLLFIPLSQGLHLKCICLDSIRATLDYELRENFSIQKSHRKFPEAANKPQIQIRNENFS